MIFQELQATFCFMAELSPFAVYDLLVSKNPSRPVLRRTALFFK